MVAASACRTFISTNMGKTTMKMWKMSSRGKIARLPGFPVSQSIAYRSSRRDAGRPNSLRDLQARGNFYR
jgi:hypothetical protein